MRNKNFKRVFTFERCKSTTFYILKQKKMLKNVKNIIIL